MGDFQRNDLVELIGTFHSMDPATGSPIPYPVGYRFKYNAPDPHLPECSQVTDIQRNTFVDHVPDKLLKKV